jgi:hypothetical protein
MNISDRLIELATFFQREARKCIRGNRHLSWQRRCIVRHAKPALACSLDYAQSHIACSGTGCPLWTNLDVMFFCLLRSNLNLFLRQTLGKKSGDRVSEREGNYSWALEGGGNNCYGATLQITGHTLALGLGTFGEGG